MCFFFLSFLLFISTEHAVVVFVYNLELGTLKFVASEHKIIANNNGVNNGESKDVIIEPDEPSVVSKEDEDSKVNNLICQVKPHTKLMLMYDIIIILLLLSLLSVHRLESVMMKNLNLVRKMKSHWRIIS
jgi:hypothetical protein